MNDKLSELYNRVSESYNQSQSQLILKRANNQSFVQICQQEPHLKKILSLGIGDGSYVIPYAKQFAEVELFGLDISPKMLEKASENLQFNAYLGDISKASDVLDQVDFDLIMAHFVLAYVPLSTILKQVDRLLASSGYFAVVTNLSSSFGHGMNLLDTMRQSYNPIHRIMYNHVHSVLEELTIPESLEALCLELSSAGFDVIASDSLSIPIVLNTTSELEDFFIKGGWFVSGLIHKYIPTHLLMVLFKRVISGIVTFPYDDTAEIAIVLAKKKS